MTRPRRDAQVWDEQRAAQRAMSPEDRLRQNDAMTRLRLEAESARRRLTVA
ncbi:MAG TPA: hypothetical protein VHC63_01695 [Acidimicrobiales bacterium]|nr:hypothetical protein [Acidimicrobiales bacterium]